MLQTFQGGIGISSNCVVFEIMNQFQKISQINKKGD